MPAILQTKENYRFALCNSYKIYMLVKLWVENYATYDGFVNGINGIFKASKMTYCDKIIIWIMFQNCKIGTLTRKKYNHYYNIESK